MAKTSTPVRDFLDKLKPVEELLDELKGEAMKLLEHQGVPTRPPTPEPIPQARIEVLKEGVFRTKGGRRVRGWPGQDLITAESNVPTF